MPNNMIKQSSLLKWTSNNRQSMKGSNRQWIHPPDTLQRGHIAYLVKFLGNTEVEHAKGIEIVKEGIRKLKFSSQIRRSEGEKVRKVELTISINGVAIQEPKTKRILHQYPLHRISYCADEKAEKKCFSFIAKEADSDKHVCFVFVSDKLAEEITLTIGQAFDLAYRRFLETSGRDLEMKKQILTLQKKVNTLEAENQTLRQRLTQVESLDDVENLKRALGLTDLLVNGTNPPSQLPTDSRPALPSRNVLPPSDASALPPPVPPRANETQKPLSPSEELIKELGFTLPIVGPRLENLALDDMEDFDPRANDEPRPNDSTTIANGSSLPPPSYCPPTLNGSSVVTSTTTPTSHDVKDLFGAEPFVPNNNRMSAGQALFFSPTVNNNTVTTVQEPEDPFGMGDFGQVPTYLGAQELETAIGAIDRRISEMRDGFSRGISFANEDFSLEALDPLAVNNRVVSTSSA